MSTVVCGTHTLTIDTALGARVARARIRTTAADPLGAARTQGLPQPFLLGRDEAVSLAHTAVENREPVNFHASCGYGKTTLLRHLVALGPARGATQPHVYLKVGDFGLDDLLQRLVAELYTLRPPEASGEPVRLTTQQCAQVLRNTNALVALDDVALTEGQIAYVRRMVPGCALVIGSSAPVLGEGGHVHDLGGLAQPAGVSLLARDLGRLIQPEETQHARDLVAAVLGQPLHIRQAAALVTSGEHTLAALAALAEEDPGELDRLSIDALTADERRVLAVFAFAAGALMPSPLVSAMADVAYVATVLDSLFHKGLVERPDDRFGLPVCKGETYRGLLLGYFTLATAERGLVEWLREYPADGDEALSALESAVGLLGYAAGAHEWLTVIRIVRAVEPVLFVQGRWETWQRVVSCGLEAALELHDQPSEAYFAHQRGTLLFFHDRAEEARADLERALDIRDRLADEEGAERTRENLAFVVAGPDGPAPPRRGRPRGNWRRIRRAALIAGAGLTAIVLGGLVLDALGLTGPDEEGRDRRPGVPADPTPGPSDSGNNGDQASPKREGDDDKDNDLAPADERISPLDDGEPDSPGQDGEDGEDSKDSKDSKDSNNGKDKKDEKDEKDGGDGKGNPDDGTGERESSRDPGRVTPASPVVSPGSTSFRDALTGAGSTEGLSVQGGRRETRTFTVRNPGAKVSTVDQVELTGSDAFVVATDDCSAADLGPGRQTSCTVTVTFDPREAGEHAARLTVGWKGLTSFAELSGTGYAVVRVDRDQPQGGTGSVDASHFAEKDCDGTSCSYRVQSQAFTLTAVGNGMRFVEWQDACQGREPECSPPLTGIQHVVALFKPAAMSAAVSAAPSSLG